MEIEPLLAAAQAKPPGFGEMLFPLVLVMIISYVLFIKPQQRQQRERDETVKKLKAGDRVITIGGIHGTVSAVKEGTVVVQVSDKTKLTFNSSSISEILPDKSADSPEAKKKR